MSQPNSVVIVDDSDDIVTVVVGSAPDEEVVTSSTELVEVRELDLKGEDGKDGDPGKDGKDGKDGEPGPPGPPGGQTYVHHQDVPAVTWTVAHGLNTYPAVTVVDSANETVEGDIRYLDQNTIELTFGAPFSGTAYVI